MSINPLIVWIILSTVYVPVVHLTQLDNCFLPLGEIKYYTETVGVQSGRQVGSNSATAPQYINTHFTTSTSSFSVVHMLGKLDFAAHGVIHHQL